MNEKKRSFVMYTDFIERTNALSDAAFREVVAAACHYTEFEQLPELSTEAAIAFQFIKVTLDKDRVKWEAITERNRTNGSKGGRPPKPK